MIPDNISKKDILSAINKINDKGIPEKRWSERYFVLNRDFIYPPTYVVSLANKFANNIELKSLQFAGGEESNSFLNHWVLP